MLIVAGKPIMMSVDMLNVVSPYYDKELITAVKGFIEEAPQEGNLQIFDDIRTCLLNNKTFLQL